MRACSYPLPESLRSMNLAMLLFGVSQDAYLGPPDGGSLCVLPPLPRILPHVLRFLPVYSVGGVPLAVLHSLAKSSVWGYRFLSRLSPVKRHMLLAYRRRFIPVNMLWFRVTEQRLKMCNPFARFSPVVYVHARPLPPPVERQKVVWEGSLFVLKRVVQSSLLARLPDVSRHLSLPLVVYALYYKPLGEDVLPVFLFLNLEELSDVFLRDLKEEDARLARAAVRVAAPGTVVGLGRGLLSPSLVPPSVSVGGVPPLRQKPQNVVPRVKVVGKIKCRVGLSEEFDLNASGWVVLFRSVGGVNSLCLPWIQS